MFAGHRKTRGRMQVRRVPLAVRREPPSDALEVVAQSAPHLSRTARPSVASETWQRGACVNEQYPSCGCDLTQTSVASRRGAHLSAAPAWPLKQQLSLSRYHPGSVGQGACASLCLRQDRPRGVRERPDGPRRRAGRQRGHRESPGRGRDRSHGSCPDHRCAGDAGRAREDLAPGHPCRHPGRPVDQVPSRGPRRPGHHSDRPCRLQPVPVRGATFRRDDGHRRSDDDPGRGEELRVTSRLSFTPASTGPSWRS